MKVELFLRHINQEMIDVNSKASVKKHLAKEGMRKRSGGSKEWAVWGSWTNSCCICDCFRVDDPRILIDPPPFMLIRKEGNEGLVWNKKNHRVYKVDEEAYQVLHDLDVGVRVEDVAKRHNITVPKIMNLVKIIKKECR